LSWLSVQLPLIHARMPSIITLPSMRVASGQPQPIWGFLADSHMLGVQDGNHTAGWPLLASYSKLLAETT